MVIFSHRLGGTTDGGAVWGAAWAAAGFAVLHVQHAGNDLAAVRTVAGSFADRRTLRSLAGPQQLMDRLRDIGFVLDEVVRRHGTGAGHWASVRPNGMGMSGHSFGAHTTMGMAGQRYPGFEGIAEPRLGGTSAAMSSSSSSGVRASSSALAPRLSVVGSLRCLAQRYTRGAKEIYPPAAGAVGRWFSANGKPFGRAWISISRQATAAQ